jgi:hypothetical protein
MVAMIASAVHAALPVRGAPKLRFLEHHIADKRVLRLIAKWLKVGLCASAHSAALGKG